MRINEIVTEGWKTGAFLGALGGSIAASGFKSNPELVSSVIWGAAILGGVWGNFKAEKQEKKDQIKKLAFNRKRKVWEQRANQELPYLQELARTYDEYVKQNLKKYEEYLDQYEDIPRDSVTRRQYRIIEDLENTIENLKNEHTDNIYSLNEIISLVNTAKIPTSTLYKLAKIFDRADISKQILMRKRYFDDDADDTSDPDFDDIMTTDSNDPEFGRKLETWLKSSAESINKIMGFYGVLENLQNVDKLKRYMEEKTRSLDDFGKR
jgi:hypothetical protein